MLTALQIRKFTKLFTMYDTDNSGILGLEDFEKVAKKIIETRGWTANSPKSLSLSSRFSYYWIHIKGETDENRDHKVSLEEWLKYYEVLLQDSHRYKLEINSLIDLIFDIFDTDGDGNINKTEWVNFMSVYNIHRFYAEATFKKIDINENGLLSKEEFLEVLYDFHYSDELEDIGNMLFIPY